MTSDAKIRILGTRLVGEMNANKNTYKDVPNAKGHC